MDFRLSAEQRLLRDAVARYARNYLEGRRAHLAAWNAHELGAKWREMAGLGWLGVGFPEAVGGYGGGPVEEMLIHAGAGAALAVEPLMAARLGAHVLTLAAPTEASEALLAPVFAGESLIIFAHDEADTRGDVSHVGATARPTRAGGYVLAGRKAVAHGAPQADKIIVSASIPDAGLSLFLLDSEGLSGRMRACRTVDGLSAADIDLTDLLLSDTALVASGPRAKAAVATAFDRMAVAACADAVGAMDATIALTVQHLNSREQFGARLGAFQALQHKLADMVIDVEQARSMLLYGLAALTSEVPDDRMKGVSAALVRVFDSARLVAANAVQLHGGIGVTEEHVVSHYFRRLTAFTGRFGGRARQLARFSSYA
jgi:alkylation response protein AidB-like acyl-CoA dehydrogenase